MADKKIIELDSLGGKNIASQFISIIKEKYPLLGMAGNEPLQQIENALEGLLEAVKCGEPQYQVPL